MAKEATGAPLPAREFCGLADLSSAAPLEVLPLCLDCLDLHYAKPEREPVSGERNNWPVPETLLAMGLPVSFGMPTTRRVAAGEGRVKTLVTQLMNDAGVALPEAGR